MIDAIAEGFRAPELQQRLEELSWQKVELEASIKASAAPLPRLHPNMAEFYRRKVEHLQDALNDKNADAEALEILRGLIEKIVVRYTSQRFEIELVGHIANMVEISYGKVAGQSQFRRSVKVVAGERNQRYFGLFSARIPRMARPS